MSVVLCEKHQRAASDQVLTQEAEAGHTHRTAGSQWLQAYLIFQIICQLALLVPQIGSVRIVVRTAAFAANLVLLIFLPGRASLHPSAGPARWIWLIVGLSILHPLTNSWLSGVAQSAVYVAVLAPLFWVSRLHISPHDLRRALLLFWAFHTLSALVGVLQVYYPEYFQANISAVIAEKTRYADDLRIALADGRRVFRPMGLTDTPGGAAMAGMYAVLLGVTFFVSDHRAWVRAASVLSMMLAGMCLYLSQVRSLIVVTVLSLAVFLALLMLKRRMVRLALLAGVLTVAVSASFTWATSVGGKTVIDRLATLTTGRATEVYYKNRGHFLEYTVKELLPAYPLGAGLGRWGMVHHYLGSDKDAERAAIWVEIQWTGWLLDGGIPLMLAYTAAILLALGTAWTIAISDWGFRISDLEIPNPHSAIRNRVWVWGAMLLAYNVGILAITFNYPFFIGQGGIDFWLLNTVVFVAARTEKIEDRGVGE